MQEASSLLAPSSGVSIPDGQPTDPTVRASGADRADTIVNVSNIAMGTGMLALPYALQHGGLVVGLVGLAVMLYWNYLCCEFLVECKDELQGTGPSGKAPTEAKRDARILRKIRKPTFATIGYMAIGPAGEWLVNGSIAVTLLGACTTYLIYANDLLQDTPLYVGHGLPASQATLLNTALYCLCMYPLTMVKNMAPLAKVSVLAVVALFAGFAVIIYVGVDTYGWPSLEDLLHWPNLVFPTDIKSFSDYFGVAVFSFGVTVMVFNVQESMSDQNDFLDTLIWSMDLVWAAYVVTAGVAAMVFSPAPGGVSDDVMKDLPTGTPVSSLIRLFMCAAALLTYPLVIQPVVEMLERAVAGGGGREPLKDIATAAPAYGALGKDGKGTGTDVQDAVEAGQAPPYPTMGASTGVLLGTGGKLAVRAALVLTTGVFATCVPHFGLVISLIGCASISLASFVLPPLFHLILCRKRLDLAAKAGEGLLLAVGAFVCVFTTGTTIAGALKSGGE